jgi:adenylate cyclase
MRKPTLSQLFTLSLIALAAALGLLWYVVVDATGAAIVESSEHVRAATSLRIGERVAGFLAQAPRAVRDFELALAGGRVRAREPDDLEAALAVELRSSADVGELTLTYARRAGFGADGAATLDAAPRGQVSVARLRDGGAAPPDLRNVRRIVSRRVRATPDGRFVAERRELPEGSGAPASAFLPETPDAVDDPTLHATFTSPASRENEDVLLWSDLHWSQLDAALPEERRRVEVSVQKAVADAAGEFVGVLRVGLLVAELDRAVAAGMERGDPHEVFLCDADGRVVTRGVASDRRRLFGDDLRVAPEGLPPEIAASRFVSGPFEVGGAAWLATFRPLTDTQGWSVGIVVPRAAYVQRLVAMREKLLALLLGLVAAVLLAGGLVLLGVRRANAQITRESARMDRLEFAPAPTASPFRDVAEVLRSLEGAKTAMRALGRYVPIDLVRRLWRDRREPTLGGAPAELSLLFTDVQDFTTLAERLAPDELAAALGSYLDAMTRVIQREHGGTIDKFIGDSVMAFWNAPEPVADDAARACRAALRCRDEVRALALAPEWRGRPPFETRFGLHRDRALVGHFGARDRMNYTAIGDAVNLASRLEGLNKEYGTTILASEKMAAAAGERFEFRRLDLVAVKGRSGAIAVLELIGERDGATSRPPHVTNYEAAFEAYARRDFVAAIALLERQADDPPSRVLLERCRAFRKAPPPPEWRGVFVAATK